MHEKVVLITGAARRIGAAITRTLHADGARVAIHCHRSRDAAETLAADLNAARADSARVFMRELHESESAEELIGKVVGKFGRLDGLVNNASAFYATPLGSIGGKEWADIMSSNLKAPLFLAQAAAPHLAQAIGAIVNIVDIHAERPLKDFVVYSIAKAGLAALTRSLALELGPRVRVNGVSPGAILWPEDGRHFTADEQQRILDQVPLQRTGAPEDIAGAVKFLLFDAPYVTGQILAVDGGRSVFQ